MTLPRLRLKKHEDRRLRRGHLWVFSNEIDTRATPLKGLEPGALVQLEDPAGKPLGIAYVNPSALICARLLTRNASQSIDDRFWQRRLESAWHWRQRLFDKPFYRLVHGEGDGLPGLVVDRFDQVLVAQCNSAGIERQLPVLLTALDSLLAPATVVLRNDSPARLLEGLPQTVSVQGQSISPPLEIEENGQRFLIDPVHGQKTGWFFDHRSNRQQAAQLANGRRVLDLFSYSAAWGIQAAGAGAEEVVCVDSSEAGLTLARDNAKLNQVISKMTFVKADVFEYLKQGKKEGQTFDLVIADPPAFIKRRKDLIQGIEGYRRLNRLALALLKPGGILISCSCSHHLPGERLQHLICRAGHALGQELALFKRGGQGPDHPIHPAIPETEYLIAQFYRVQSCR